LFHIAEKSTRVRRNEAEQDILFVTKHFSTIQRNFFCLYYILTKHCLINFILMEKLLFV